MSAAAAAGRYRRALGWELGPHRGLGQKSDADWGEEGGGRRARGGDQGAARRGLMLDPGGDPGGGRIQGVGAGAGLEGPRPPPALRSPGLGGSGSRALCSTSLFLRSGRGEAAAVAPAVGRGTRPEETLGSWELGTAPAAAESRWALLTFASECPFPFLGLGWEGRGGIWLWAGNQELRVLSSRA